MKLVKNREGNLVSEINRECTSCGVIFEITSKMTLCPKCNCRRVKCTDPRKRMLNRAQQRAKRQGIECNISWEDIIIPEYCPVLGIKLQRHEGSPGGRNNSPALDRVDNSRGYVVGNILVISHLANMMKSCADDDSLIKFANWVLETYTPSEK